MDLKDLGVDDYSSYGWMVLLLRNEEQHGVALHLY
jgi:hypothetical protein